MFEFDISGLVDIEEADAVSPEEQALKEFWKAYEANKETESKLAEARKTLEAFYPKGENFPKWFPFNWNYVNKYAVGEPALVSPEFITPSINSSALRDYLHKNVGKPLPLGVVEKGHWQLAKKKKLI